MPSRAAILGIPPATAGAVLGFLLPISLITLASGNAQNGYVISGGDDVLVTGANGGNNSLTLPSTTQPTSGPAGGTLQTGDWIDITNGTAQACVIFPATGGQINAQGVNASIALPAWARLRAKVIPGVNTWQVG